MKGITIGIVALMVVLLLVARKLNIKDGRGGGAQIDNRRTH